jgi:hypothetical protein
LREHVDTFGVAADGRIFSSDRGHPRRLHRHQRRLGRGPESCPDPCPGCLKPGRASLRPPPCGCLAMAKRGGVPASGSRARRAQCRSTASGLCQVP